MHADQLTNGGGAELAAELGAVTADHLEQTEAPGIAAMKRAGVQPVLLPGRFTRWARLVILARAK